MNFLIISKDHKNSKHIENELKDYGLCTIIIHPIDEYLKFISNLFTKKLFDVIFFDVSLSVDLAYNVIDIIKKERELKKSKYPKKFILIAIIDENPVFDSVLNKFDFLINKSLIKKNIEEVFYDLNIL